MTDLVLLSLHFSRLERISLPGTVKQNKGEELGKYLLSFFTCLGTLFVTSSGPSVTDRPRFWVHTDSSCLPRVSPLQSVSNSTFYGTPESLSLTGDFWCCRGALRSLSTQFTTRIPEVRFSQTVSDLLNNKEYFSCPFSFVFYKFRYSSEKTLFLYKVLRLIGCSLCKTSCVLFRVGHFNDIEFLLLSTFISPPFFRSM